MTDLANKCFGSVTKLSLHTKSSCNKQGKRTISKLYPFGTEISTIDRLN